ncbi:ketoacyl-ACP synthase III [Bacteroidia bacterium]|jgi:3-oxoacyl-[acyl-carrier-protein] synthase-3|nr:ketoacyl-ACP synthase III [Bacteroidota bacterium]MDA8930144.1 ketoacyl-ACP synthase III [Bacteroidia bacterium]MDB4174150.1 ketoacyl-ACP synthase III [Bacteroidia bacterium]
MNSAIIKGMGYYVPSNVVTNDDLSKIMDTNDEWITERTGIKERRWINSKEESTSSMALEASKNAIADAKIDKAAIDFIIFATLSPDYYFPGPGVTLQKELGLDTIGALDVRNQCSGFVYALSIADQYIKTGMYENILVVGSEYHSGGLDKTTRGRGVSVIFGDGAGAAIVSKSPSADRGILSTHLHAQGEYAEELALIGPSTKRWVPEIFNGKGLEDEAIYPYMNGTFVFKHAVTRFPQVIGEALEKNGHQSTDIDLLIPHQANLRISQFVQKKMQLRDDQVFNNIQKYGNTTAASIPIALAEAKQAGKVKEGDLICLAAFGSGFTWASALIRW